MTEGRQLAVIIGAGSAIGKAVARHWVKNDKWIVVGVKRPSSEPIEGYKVYETDYSQQSLDSVAKTLGALQISVAKFIVCNGLLSNDVVKPERRLVDTQMEAFETVFEINTFLPIRVLRAFWLLLERSKGPKIAIFSARVGSIGDNHLGGWYAYRGSKAALNMMLKSAALEMRRRNPNAKFLAYHPGTVDTPLSRPFQRNVHKKTLLTADFSAQRLDCLLDKNYSDGELSYLDWEGKVIPW